MARIMTCLLLGSSLLLSTQANAESLTWATEVDLLPIATGGWYTSLAVGREAWRVRAVAAEVHVPDAFAPKGWVSSRTRAQALLVDRFFRPGFTGPWVGAGFERWDESLKREHGPERVKLTSLQSTLGAGWVFELGRGFTLNPWMAVHRRIAGDRDATIEQAVCRPRALQAEASLKIGYTFNHH
jgi:hypothetical protein